MRKRSILFIHMDILISKELDGMTKREELTEKQRLVYDGIVDYQMQYGYAPSIRELCVICNLASTSSVYAHLKKLEELGYIRRREDAPRAIAIV